MKTFAFFITLFISVQVYGQQVDLSRKINFSIEHKTLKEALILLEKVGQIQLAYDDSQLSTKSNNSLEVSNTPISEVLSRLLTKKGFSYKAFSSKIIIFKQKEIQPQPTTTSSILKLEGKIIDQKSQLPIPFAHVIIVDSTYGTVANEIGDFNLVISPSIIGKKVSVSCIGYETHEFTAVKQNQPIIISLQPSITLLHQVTVKGKRENFKVEDLIKEVIKKIPVNYSTESTVLTGYYRELTKSNNVYSKFSDAACEIYYTGYGSKNNEKQARSRYFNYELRSLNNYPFPSLPTVHKAPYLKDEVKIIEARSSDDLYRYHAIKDKSDPMRYIEHYAIGGGPIRLSRYDCAKNLDFILNKKIRKKFQFELVEYIKYNNRYVYIVEFKAKKIKQKPLFTTGTIVIDAETKSILKLSYHLPEENKDKLKHVHMSISNFNKSLQEKYGLSKRIIVRKLFTKGYRVEVEYALINGKTHLKRISEKINYLSTGDALDDVTFEISSDLIINQVRTQSTSIPPKKDLFRSCVSNFLFRYPLTYNAGFWRRYPYALTDAKLEEALKDLEKTHSLDEQFERKVKQDPDLLAPTAVVHQKSTSFHQDTLKDDYAWMRNQYSDTILNYLDQENQYLGNYMIPWRKEIRSSYYEMIDKVQKNYKSLPTKIGGYYYFVKYEADKPHEIYTRKKDTKDAEEEIILDVNNLDRGERYLEIEDIILSPNQSLLAFTENLTGGDQFSLRFKDLNKHQILDDSLTAVVTLEWLNDQTILYTKADSSNRSYQVYEHTLGNDQANDLLVFEENDPKYSVWISKSKSKKYIYLYSKNATENEVFIRNINMEGDSFKLLKSKQEDHKYYLQDYKDDFFILSNKHNPNFDLFRVKASAFNTEEWKPVLSYQNDTLINGIQLIGDHLIVAEKIKMKPRLKIINLKTKAIDYIQVDSTEVHNLSFLSSTADEKDTLRYRYSSPTCPSQTYTYHLRSKHTSFVKQSQVNDYNQADYTCKRIYATSKDSTRIPITLVYKTSISSSITRQVHLKGYGAYGINQGASFDISILPFLDQGGVMAYAHVRGGNEFGEQWHRSGKLLQKKNTFSDFITCAEYLVAQEWVKKGELIISGASAGGLLIGTVINLRPDLFKVAILQVPFLDVLNTMLDETLPLTIGEYKEWGNPKEKAYYDYIKSYCPYQNIKSQEYPNLLFISHFHDQRVGFWEAAKMVAKLRANHKGNNKILLQTNMYSGHSGGSGRYARFKNAAFINAFIQSIFKP